MDNAQNININNNSSKFPIRAVPIDLLPKNEKHLTEEWLHKTIKYKHLFDINVIDKDDVHDNDIEEWKKICLKLMKSIKQRGISVGRKHLVNLACDTFGLRLTDSDTNELVRPTCISDVFSIVTNKDWYERNKKRSRNIIYQLVYGITRSGLNNWVEEEEQRILNELRIQYKTDGEVVRKSILKGFVHKLLISIFSNTTIKYFQNGMERSFGEFISVRKKKGSSSKRMQYDYKPYKFAGGHGYIVSCKSSQNDISDLYIQDMYSTGRSWVMQCKQKKLSIDSIIQMVNVYYNEPDNDVAHTTKDDTPVTTNNQTTPLSDKHFEVELQQWMNKKNSEFFIFSFAKQNLYYLIYFVS